MIAAWLLDAASTLNMDFGAPLSGVETLRYTDIVPTRPLRRSIMKALFYAAEMPTSPSGCGEV